jgi:murein DD-endopeptidase MepM/ murein hydrolase activator NlpD
VKNGIVSQTFGIHNHPILKHVKIRNNGINIATDKGELARAVFEGTVVSVMAITSTNIAIIVKHGDYFTVFSGLDRSFVSQGDVVQPGKALGTVHTNLQGKTELHFELWKGKQYQNPAGWLAKKS